MVQHHVHWIFFPHESVLISCCLQHKRVQFCLYLDYSQSYLLAVTMSKGTVGHPNEANVTVASPKYKGIIIYIDRKSVV